MEEYAKGSSLYELLQNPDSISLERRIEISIMICDILWFLHQQKPYPILYQDFKPEHIIVCGTKIKLIDFGIANILTNQGNNYQTYGTRNYVSPEVLAGEQATVASDIYNLGCLFEKLFEQLCDNCPKEISQIIDKMKAFNPAKRPKNILEIQRVFTKVKSSLNNCENQEDHFLKLAVIGDQRGIGSTQFSISLTIYLNMVGRKAFYCDGIQQGVLEGLTRVNPSIKEDNDIIYHDNFFGVADFREKEREKKLPKGILVMDIDKNDKDIEEYDYIFYICSGVPWKYPSRISRLMCKENVLIIMIGGTKNYQQALAKYCHKKVYGYPLEKFSFFLSNPQKRWFEKMWKGCIKDV